MQDILSPSPQRNAQPLGLPGLGFFLGLKHSSCLVIRAPITTSCCWTHLCQNLTPTGRSHHSAASLDLVCLKVSYSALTFKWQFRWGILGWKSFVIRILKTWLCFFLTLQIAVEWHRVIMILCLKSVFLSLETYFFFVCSFLKFNSNVPWCETIFIHYSGHSANTLN